MRVSVALLLGTLIFASSALAQDDQSGPPPAPPRGSGQEMSGPPMGGPFRQACGADIQNLCPTAQTPRDRNLCLRQNPDRISGTCSSFLAERRARRMQRMQSQGAAAGQSTMTPDEQMPPGGPGAPPPNQQGPGQGPPNQAPPDDGPDDDGPPY